MIISFTIDNWMSFRDSTSFSMVASKERQHGDRVPKITKYQTRILPVATIYGGNASGKTNFFRALSFVKWMVLKGAGPDRTSLPVEPFLLDQASIKKPSRFILELLVDNTIYELSFAVTRSEIVEEKLVEISSTSEKILYDRKRDSLKLDSSLNKDQFLHFAFKGTRDNQLFLTNSVSQKVNIFRPVYDWFKNNLVLIAPDSRFRSLKNFLDDGHPLYSTLNELLPQLDTGISNLGQEEIPFEDISLPENLKNLLQEELKEGRTIRLPISEPVIITRKAGNLVAKKLVTFHLNNDGNEVPFDLRQESDGTNKLIDLLPAFLELSTPRSKKVYVIDEIDRSLHSLLTQQLIELYLENCGTDSRAQLLITTHNILLMDQGLFRRDEMWVTERDQKGSSEIFSFSDYKDVRYDKDIRKSYLQGRLGGVPRFLLSNSLTNLREDG